MPQALHKFHFDSNRDRGGKREGGRGGQERDRCSCGGGKMEQRQWGAITGEEFPLYFCWSLHALTSKTCCFCLGWINAFH